MDNGWPLSITDDAIIVSISSPGDPIAHERPRIGRDGHTYTPQKTQEYRERIAWDIKMAPKADILTPPAYGLQALFYRSNRQRIDVDNLLKSVMDAATQARIWRDDSLVREVVGRLFTAQENPRTDFVIYALNGEEMTGHSCKGHNIAHNCQHCGKPIPETSFYPSSHRKYCSPHCASSSKRIKMICKECGKEFEIARCQERQKAKGNEYHRGFCSRECSIAFHTKLKKAGSHASDKWVCTICGNKVSRKEYKICRACSMKTRGDPASNYWRLRHKVNPQNGEPIGVAIRIQEDRGE